MANPKNSLSSENSKLSIAKSEIEQAEKVASTVGLIPAGEPKSAEAKQSQLNSLYPEGYQTVKVVIVGNRNIITFYKEYRAASLDGFEPSWLEDYQIETASAVALNPEAAYCRILVNEELHYQLSAEVHNEIDKWLRTKIATSQHIKSHSLVIRDIRRVEVSLVDNDTHRHAKDERYDYLIHRLHPIADLSFVSRSVEEMAARYGVTEEEFSDPRWGSYAVDYIEGIEFGIDRETGEIVNLDIE